MKTHQSIEDSQSAANSQGPGMNGRQDSGEPQKRLASLHRMGAKGHWVAFTILVLAGIAILACLEFSSAYRMMESIHSSVHHERMAFEYSLSTWIPWALLSPLFAFLAVRCNPVRMPWSRALLCYALCAAIGTYAAIQGERQLFAIYESLNHENCSTEAKKAEEALEVVLSDEEKAALGEDWESMIETVEAEAVTVKAAEVTPPWWPIYFKGIFKFLGLSTLGLIPALALVSGERERRRAEIQRELARTENRLLRSQLQPHFLFNALNGVQVLIDEDPGRAKGIIQRLSGLLRATLNDAHQPMITLEQELAVLEDYLAIERLRFEDRVSFDLHVKPGSESVSVPSFSLQPLVENSLRHGAGARPEGGKIEIHVNVVNGFLELKVADDGPGIKDLSSMRQGHGLGILRQRLAKLFNGEGELRIESPVGQGFHVTVRIPIESGEN